MIRWLAVSLPAAGGVWALASWRYYHPPGLEVSARVETAPVPHRGDAADDPAIWVDRADPAASLVIGTDKKGGLLVHDLTGAEVQRFDNGAQNNVDLRDGVPWTDGEVALVVASATDAHQVFLYRVDAAARRLVWLESSSFAVGVEPMGISLYRSARTNRLFCFVNGEDLASEDSGIVEQWELRLDPAGERLAAERVRRFDVGHSVEGCACDDANAAFFVSEESEAVWRYGAEPDAGEERVEVERVGLSGRLRYNAEGIAVLAQEDGGGWLVVSSQGSDDFTVYDRRPPHAYRGRFRLVASDGVDGVSHTDGIDGCTAPLGPRFPAGLFVAQDDDNDGGNQDFKLASWGEVLAALAEEEE